MSLKLNKDQTSEQTTIELIIVAASPEKALKIYDSLERILIELSQADLGDFQNQENDDSTG